MRKAVIPVLGLFLFGFLGIVCFADDAQEPAGKKLFVDIKCNMCHSIQSQSIEKKMASSKAPDLSNVGAEKDAEWITKWLKKEVDLDGKKHPASMKLADADLKTLADWLPTLKTPPAK